MPLEIYSTALIRAVLTDPNAFATTMIVVLTDYFGAEFFQWTPDTIRMETEQDFNFKWPQVNFDRLLAGMVLVTTDRFYKSTPDFVELCTILSGAPATMGVFEPADAADCAWGLTEALLLAPSDEEEPFTEEIRGYIGKACEMEGIITPPDILRLGIQSEDFKIKVHNTYSDDPEMYSAIWKTEADKTNEINELVKDRLTLLVQQLASLKLVNGSTANIAKRMLKNLNAAPADGDPL
jgi:hypothetical protein